MPLPLSLEINVTHYTQSTIPTKDQPQANQIASKPDIIYSICYETFAEVLDAIQSQVTQVII